MEKIDEVRNQIDDHVQIGFSKEISDGTMTVYQLNARNFWNLEVKVENVTVDPAEMTLYPLAGQIKAALPAGMATFEYEHAGFTDEEIGFYLEKNGDDVDKASLRLVEILLASAAKRFDYKAGLKDIKASQVFDHLKELRLQLTERITANDPTSGDTPLFVNRAHPAYDVDLEHVSYWRDVSRSDI